MKTIKLIKLVIENFKGIKNFVLEPNGESINIHGDNGTGKTTLLDAFQWLFFDKNGDGKKDFSIKTIVNNEVLHNLNHSVEGIFNVSGETLTLKKVFYEGYTKKRGSVTAEFTGHKTDYFIDGVPSKKKEYEEKIKSIIDEEIFKTITSVRHLATLNKEKRREIVMSIVGEPTIDDVLEFDPTVKAIVDIKDIQGRKKILESQRKEVNKQLESIPVRIDELSKQIGTKIEPEYSEKDKADVQAKIDDVSAKIASFAAESGKKILIDEKAELVKKLTSLGDDLKSYYRFESGFIRERGNDIRRYQENINLLIDANSDLRFKHKLLFEQKPNVSESCPTCGQTVPEEKRQDAIEQFNIQKSYDLEHIKNQGLENNTRIEELKASIVECEKTNARDCYTGNIPDRSDMDAITKQIEALEIQIENYSEDETDKARIELENERVSLQSKLSDINTAIAMRKAEEDSRKRIIELEGQQKEHARQFCEIEKELNLIERFTRAKMTLVQDRVEGKFKLAGFKMFDEQINGGISDICEITGHDGVPYPDLNNAMKINVGLDICNVIGDKLGILAPIFIDNAESVTELIESPAQIVRLVVDRECETLTVK